MTPVLSSLLDGQHLLSTCLEDPKGTYHQAEGALLELESGQGQFLNGGCTLCCFRVTFEGRLMPAPFQINQLGPLGADAKWPLKTSSVGGDSDAGAAGRQTP